MESRSYRILYYECESITSNGGKNEKDRIHRYEHGQ